MEWEEIYQIGVMGSLMTGAVALSYMAGSLAEIRDSLKYFCKQSKGLEKDLMKAKKLEEGVQK